MLSAFPELAPWQVRNLLTATASQATAPDDTLGFGTANIAKAMQRAAASNGAVVAPELVSYPVAGVQRVGVSAQSSLGMLSATLFVRFAGKQDFTPFPLVSVAGTTLFLTDIALTNFAGMPAVAYATVSDGRTVRRLPFAAVPSGSPSVSLSSLLSLVPRASSIPCGIATNTLPLTLTNGASEGVIPSYVQPSDAETTLVLATPSGGEVRVEVYSMLGQLVAEITVPGAVGVANIQIPVRGLARGLYGVQAVVGGTARRFRFMVGQ